MEIGAPEMETGAPQTRKAAPFYVKYSFISGFREGSPPFFIYQNQTQTYQNQINNYQWEIGLRVVLFLCYIHKNPDYAVYLLL
jgi:hypothetical protein